MNKKIYPSLGCALVIALSAPAQNLPKSLPSPAAPVGAPATGAGAQTSAATVSGLPDAQAQRAIPFHGKVARVDGKAKTFTVGPKEKSRTFKITDKSVITKNGQPATIKDVTANEDARGSYWKMPDGSMEVKKLRLAPAAEQEKSKADGPKRNEKASSSPSTGASPST